MAATAFRRIGEFFTGRLMLSLVALVIVLLLLWLFRYPLLRVTGRFLIKPDPELHADAVYVLGGSPLERGTEAARLVNAGLASTGVCMGENIPTVLEAEGLYLSDADLSRNVMLRAGTDSSRIELVEHGTSTWEEATAILAHAQARGHDTITVVTTEFHLRRVKRVFRKQLNGRAITVLARGARSRSYDSERWWESEEGLLMVNNEYVKLFYYWVKY